MDLGSFWISLLAGACLGILSGLGIGGGSLLILWLTMAAGLDFPTARAVSLLFFFPASAVSCIVKKGSVPWKEILPAVFWGILSAAAFSALARVLDPSNFRRFMGGLLILIGITELFHKEKT